MARTPIDAPQAREPRYGLIAAAEIIDDPTRWQAGVSFTPEACAGGGVLPLEQGCGPNLSGSFASSANPGEAVADPFVVFHVETCSTFGSARRDFQGRARRGLLATRSSYVAEALWDGYDPMQEQRALVDSASDVLTSEASSPSAVIACLEQGLMVCGRGRRGLLHVTPQLLTILVQQSLVYRDGNLWLSPMGNIVVADAGYTGNGPDDAVGNPRPAGSSQWAYATSWMRLRFSAVDVYPPNLSSEADLSSTSIWPDNSIDVLAWQLAQIEWDECCHLAAEVDLPICATGGVS